ncbi:hypothetical protein FACS189492_0510 [Clostridia bacterium]|nr:hypothetical protein FACS189492_0510 [Clostridia bacterium]
MQDSAHKYIVTGGVYRETLHVQIFKAHNSFVFHRDESMLYNASRGACINILFQRSGYFELWFQVNTYSF